MKYFGSPVHQGAKSVKRMSFRDATVADNSPCEPQRYFMAEPFCTPDRIDTIATHLNAGQSDAATRMINDCTSSLVGYNVQDALSNDPEAQKRAEDRFKEVVKEERALWQSIGDAANKKDPEGLCKLTIVEDEWGPHIELKGDKCKPQN